MGTLRELDNAGNAKVNVQLAEVHRDLDRANKRKAHLAGLVAGLEVTITDLQRDKAKLEALVKQLNGENAALKEHANRQGEELFKLRGPDPAMAQPAT
jgi:chromosome segregation ATPase